jgi:uncharacterized protein with PQ loop repeat
VSWLDDAAVISATIVAIVALVPQARRLRHTRDAAGVSITWTAIGTVTNAGWFVYVSTQGLWASAPATVISSAFYAWLFSLLVGLGTPWRAAAQLGALWAVILTAVTSLTGFAVMGTLLGLAYAVQVGPSVWTAYRTWAPSGVAPSTWLLMLIQVVLWGVYGIAQGDVPIMIYGVTGLTASGLMLARWYLTRGRSATPVVLH